MFKRIDHVEIIPSDLEKTIDFYVNVLGFEVKRRQKVQVPPLQEVVYLRLGDTDIELLSVKDPDPSSQAQWQVGYRMMALEVDDMNETIEYLKGKGVELTLGPMTIGKSTRAEIKDPNGISIELRQW
jgi:catechol 2,3-dioxygenase-like lactoylglutathione lyase family enzyme